MEIRNLLEQLGWSKDLIEGVEEAAFQAELSAQSIPASEIKMPPIETSLDGNVIDLSGADFSASTWPRL